MGSLLNLNRVSLTGNPTSTSMKIRTKRMKRINMMIRMMKKKMMMMKKVMMKIRTKIRIKIMREIRRK